MCSLEDAFINFMDYDSEVEEQFNINNNANNNNILMKNTEYKSQTLSKSEINEFTSVTMSPNSFLQIYSIVVRRLKTTTREFQTLFIIIIPCIIMFILSLIFYNISRDEEFESNEPALVVVFIAS